jgi:phage recombination protein Bet
MEDAMKKPEVISANDPAAISEEDTKLAKWTEPTQIGSFRPQQMFDQSKVELMKRTVAVGATDDEFAMFLHQCRKTGLDPLARQIYFVKRQGKGTIQTGIDGFRVVAERTGVYAGNDEPKFERIEGAKNPVSATVTVWKVVAGIRCPFTATARWDEYYPGDSQGWAWKKMPHVMLAKCAEALALRKAFPADLSGVYAFDELEQASNGHAATLVGACIECGKEIPADETKCAECKPLPLTTTVEVKNLKATPPKQISAAQEKKQAITENPVIDNFISLLTTLVPASDARQKVGFEILGCRTLAEMKKLPNAKMAECSKVLIELGKRLEKESISNADDLVGLVQIIREDFGNA